MIREETNEETSEKCQDEHELDDVFDCPPKPAKRKQALSKSRSLNCGYDELYPLNELNQSLDSDLESEPYRRRGSATRLEKRRPSISSRSNSYVSFAEILCHFQNMDPLKTQRILTEQNAKSGHGKILGFFSPHPKLPSNLSQEKDIFLLISETKYNKSEPIHLLILQSIYSQLMGGPLTCPSLGSHWIDVGFNHTDPSIDLASVKMIGAVSLLYFITECPALADQAFHLSTSKARSFPLAIVGLNFSRAIVKLVRKEILNSHFIRQKKLICIVMDLYCSVWYKFYTIWKINDPMVRDLTCVTTELENDIIIKPLSLLTQFDKAMKRCGKAKLGTWSKIPFLMNKRSGLKLSASSTNVRSVKSVS